MKTALNFFSATLVGAAFASAQVATTPVGYTTQTIYDGVTNLVGITMHGSTVASGSVSSVTGSVVTVADGVADGLTGGPYIFEVTSGTLAGAVNLITSSNGASDTLTTEDDLGTLGLSTSDTYVVREASTLGSVFGTGDNVVINKGDASTGDLIYVPVGGGSFEVYHHSTDSIFSTGDWIRVGGGGAGADTPLVYSDAVYVRNRSGANYDLVVTGEVKTTPTKIGLPDTFNYISAVYPTGVTLDSSGIADSAGFLKGDASTGDMVFMPDSSSPGTYRVFHHTNDSIFSTGEWLEIGGGSAGSVELSSGIVIKRRAAGAYNAEISVPSSWVTN